MIAKTSERFEEFTGLWLYRVRRPTRPIDGTGIKAESYMCGQGVHINVWLLDRWSVGLLFWYPWSPQRRAIRRHRAEHACP